MQYLIDGHNVIGKMPDINLDDPEDEVKLIRRLRSWAAAGHKRRVTVYFDQGLPGGLEKGLSTGPVKVVFAPAGRTADSLLINQINRVKNPSEYTLVSSDLRIIGLAAKRRMHVLRSEKFVERMVQEREKRESSAAPGIAENPPLDHDEVEMWLQLFAGDSEE